MSWAEDDWTVGLSGRVLQKVKELQVHQERLSRENKQKQLQLDNIHTSLEKQTVKYDEVRAELLSVQRELQSVRDEAKVAANNSQRLSQDIQAKQAQVCSLEGQLDGSRTVNNKLSQEIKRLETELEKLQNSSRHVDTTLFSTPCWNTASPWEHSGSRKEETDDGQSRSHHIRQRLQFSDVPSASLPRQQNRSTPHRHPSDQSDIFLTPSATFPWERDDSRPAARRPSPSSPQTLAPDTIRQGQSEQGASEKEKELRKQIDTSTSQMQSRVASLEEELRLKAESLKSIQNEMAQSKKNLAAMEVNLQKSRDELSLAQTRMAQESERTSAAEQRLKQLQEELKCQRQNAESSRLQQQQRTKELEKQHQRDVTELQKERQCLEKQHQQEVNKLNQELQQARTLHNALQAQADKLSLQKQALDKELETLKEKLKWTEGQLQESQKKVAQTQAKLTEALHEAEGVAVSLEQSRKRERALEEEGKRLAEERADALRLLKDLQEEKAASVPVQPFQYCPVGQSFSPQPSSPHLSRTSTYTKRPATSRSEQRREKAEEEESQRADIKPSYPTDREPGEGIDSDHISVQLSPESESLQKRGDGGRSTKDKAGPTECVSSGANLPSSSDLPISTSSQSDTNIKTVSEENCDVTPSADKTSPEQNAAQSDLQRENATLRSELRDVREELQKRLDDLEAQRRAEAEARTRLKQLSRKHASQNAEKQGLEKEWRTQLEREKAETERLRTALSALDLEVKREREERERKEMEDRDQDGAKNMLEDRESDTVQVNIQLKSQLAEVKAQLALERETRQREEEERNLITNTERDEKAELEMQLVELRAEFEELRQSRNEDSLEVEKLSVGNSPLAYLTLHDDELNSNFIGLDEEPLPSPEQHLLLCQSTNQHNTLVSQATSELTKEVQTLIEPERSPRSDEITTGPVVSHLKGSSLSTSYDLMKEVEHLRKENARETERADQCQVKLKVLQNQVTRQTKQLTTAFEKQSQHIIGLLAELQEKESTLHSQEEELQCCRKELDGLKAEKLQEKMSGQSEEVAVKEHLDQTGQSCESVNSSKLQTNEGKDIAAPLLTTTTLTASNAQQDANQPETVTSDGESPTSACHDVSSTSVFSETQQISVDSGCADDSSCVKEEMEDGQDSGTTALLLTLQQENRLLKEKIILLMRSDTSHVAIETVVEKQEDQNAGSAGRSCSEEERAASVSRQTPESPLPRIKSEDEGQHSEREDERAEEEVEEASPLQINLLEQQMVALQARIQALCRETQQQAEELAIWRLASQPAPAFDPVRPSTDPSQMQNLDVPQTPGNVAIIREDELFLSCSSNKLQSRIMFTSLQQNSLSELSVNLSKKSSALQEYNLETDETDKESDKENQEINGLQQLESCATQHKDKRYAELIQTSTEKTRQHLVTKEPHKAGKGQIKPKTAACHVEDPDAKNASAPPTDSSVRDVRTERHSVSSQTEESLCPRSSPTASQVHSTHTQTGEEEEEEELVDPPPVSPLRPSQGRETGDKILFSGSFPIPSDPARLAERIRRNRTQLSAAFDDTEYEPYGLPEVVMKGFADIPTGPSCPYIVRRGLLGTAVVPVSPKVPEEDETD